MKEAATGAIKIFFFLLRKEIKKDNDIREYLLFSRLHQYGREMHLCGMEPLCPKPMMSKGKMKKIIEKSYRKIVENPRYRFLLSRILTDAFMNSIPAMKNPQLRKILKLDSISPEYGLFHPIDLDAQDAANDK